MHALTIMMQVCLDDLKLYSLNLMIRARKNGRDLSNSGGKNLMKKSVSSSSNNKANISGYALGSANSSITSSIKKNRLDTTSKSNKKHVLNVSNSNKSLKELRESTNFSQGMYTLKNKDKKAKQAQQEKKGTIMVKNIKNKIVGNSHSGAVKPLKGKQNEANKKLVTKIEHFDTEGSQNPKTPRTPRQLKTNSSIANITKIAKQVSTPPCINLQMFEIGRKLGKGRFGDVFMAREIKTGFALAIKIVNKQELKESDMEAQLVQEIKIQMYSSHPNILKMYGFFDQDQKIYLLLELATNGCLFREIRQKTYFDQDLACFYFRQVTSGIRYLHSNSVIHRDIKPENILNCFGVLKICDFGWAIYSPIYQRQTFCGTLDYVPPEIVTGDFYDEKADVWCLGVLCYQLCTGKAPFESKTDESETYDKILKVEIDFPIYLSGKVVDFIGRILNREPQRRMNLEEVESHEWMRQHENEAGRMISKQVWDHWMKLTKS